MTGKSPTETFVMLRVIHDGRYSSIEQQRKLAQLLSQRGWSIDGVITTAASVFESVDALPPTVHTVATTGIKTS